MNKQFDVIVIGGGHAGTEAAHAAATMGCQTLLVTISKEKIAWMPCNPAIGGVGKGHIVFEISALGGLMPKLCTKTYLQARMLNTRKGPAVHGLRLQIDKEAYRLAAQESLAKTQNLTIHEAMVEQLMLNESGNVCGIVTENGNSFTCSAVVITTGTFLNGRVHVGEKNHSAGRREERASVGLSEYLKGLDLHMERLKTGTPPRLVKQSLDFSVMEVQPADELTSLFEFYPHQVKNTHDCYVTHTNEQSHEIIRSNRHRSPMYIGNITGKSPRYCPSIEDKVTRFADKTSHHIFVEPESATSDEMYPNGISTSLPAEIQQQFINSIKGFEKAEIAKFGYAIEYDFVHPNQLHHTLELKKAPGLFLAGQINGTTGYEEAAGQGLIAGINAACKALGRAPFILSRQESYIGVMIDDLVTLGVDEPYRMFTSRAERRIMLRQDNTFMRLMDYGYSLGMIEQTLYQDFLQEKALIEQIVADLRAKYTTGQLLEKFGIVECDYPALRAELSQYQLTDRVLTAIYAEIKYFEYIKRETKEIEKAERFQQLAIPTTFQYRGLPGLSKELQEKLTRYAPATIAQSALIPGMTPAAISLLIFEVREYMKDLEHKNQPETC